MVIEYVIGSNLEEAQGLASANIAQMIDATKRGSHLTFVLEAGGSGRWFTDGIEDGTYGRYEVHDGKLTKAADLPADTCMSKPDELASFLAWAKEAYPADRYILALWDHGGGFSNGYGMDAVNEREGDLPTLSVSEICDAIGSSGITFDIIGFDACLMQDIEVAAALEPYADYLLASEEVEGGYGWSYTSAFGMLAENPGLSSVDFGREVVACYDPYNTIIGGGEPNTTATLSFVDLPLAKAAYEQLEAFFDTAHEAVFEDSTAFADLSMAGTKSYVFSNSEQVDLIDFLQVLDRIDYGDEVVPDDQREALVNAVRACVLFRNGNSAEGVNGIALNFPVQTVDAYNLTYEQMNYFSFDIQRDFYSDFFSIIAAQRKGYLDNFEVTESTTLTDLLTAWTMTDFTETAWYREGFEDYENTPAFVDIPLTEVEDGYQASCRTRRGASSPARTSSPTRGWMTGPSSTWAWMTSAPPTMPATRSWPWTAPGCTLPAGPAATRRRALA